MRPNSTGPDSGSTQSAHVSVPPALPAWITPELIEDTIQVWQPYYKEDLTVADAVAIMVNITELLAVLDEEKMP
ncbi:MAG TPA: hypothetical protein VGG64_04595 [Pirellulales bacterium]|jgi:hypothetical protein